MADQKTNTENWKSLSKRLYTSPKTLKQTAIDRGIPANSFKAKAKVIPPWLANLIIQAWRDPDFKYEPTK